MSDTERKRCPNLVGSDRCVYFERHEGECYVDQPITLNSMQPSKADWYHPQWLSRYPTEDEQRWIWQWMTQGLTDDTKTILRGAGSGSLVEVLTEWKVIDDMLRAAGYVSRPGGGPEDDDLVRELIQRALRADRIAEMHHKKVDEHGGTYGECTECGFAWPCPTYDWARRDSDRSGLNPDLGAWDRNDTDKS